MIQSASMIRTLAFSSAEKVINQALYFDPVSLTSLQSLAGKTIAVEGNKPGFVLHIIPNDEGLSLYSALPGDDADVTLSGTTFNLIRLLRQNQPSLEDSPVKVEGDTALANQLLQLALNLDIDWEEMLSRYIGDIAAHEIGRRGRDFLRWGKKVSHSLQRNAREYLLYESQTLVSELNFQQLSSDINATQTALTQLEERIKNLQKQISTSPDKQ